MANCKTRSDTDHDRLFIETKFTARSSLWSLFQKIKPKAIKESKTPVIATLQKGTHGFLITMHIDDLEKIATECREASTKRQAEEWVEDQLTGTNR